VLKRLSEAVRDGDPVQAVIVASGSNQDGRTGGLSMPNGDAGFARDSWARTCSGSCCDSNRTPTRQARRREFSRGC